MLTGKPQMDFLSSKERLLTAINCEEPDHVPFVPSFIGPWVDQYWKGKGWTMDMLQLGLDQFVSLDAPWGHHPDVKVRIWKEYPSGHKYPLIFKIYETPAGNLRQVVNQTDDWPHGDDIPLFSDFVVAGGRSVEYLIKGPEDVEKFRYLLWEPSKKQFEDFHQKVQKAKAFADRYGLLVNGIGGYGGTFLPQICGFQNLLVWITRRPEIVKGLLEIVHEWDLRRVRLILRENPDIVTRDGWYESPIFWSMNGFEKLIEPLVREELDLVHTANIKFRYVMTIGLIKILKKLKDLDIDVIFGFDPVAENVSPEDFKSEIDFEICIWGGINENVTFQQSAVDDLRRAIMNLIKTFAPGGGYILSTVGSILQREGWERNGPVLIDAWRKYGKYPIK